MNEGGSSGDGDQETKREKEWKGLLDRGREEKERRGRRRKGKAKEKKRERKRKRKSERMPSIRPSAVCSTLFRSFVRSFVRSSVLERENVLFLHPLSHNESKEKIKRFQRTNAFSSFASFLSSFLPSFLFVSFFAFPFVVLSNELSIDRQSPSTPRLWHMGHAGREHPICPHDLSASSRSPLKVHSMHLFVPAVSEQRNTLGEQMSRLCVSSLASNPVRPHGSNVSACSSHTSLPALTLHSPQPMQVTSCWVRMAWI